MDPDGGAVRCGAALRVPPRGSGSALPGNRGAGGAVLRRSVVTSSERARAGRGRGGEGGGSARGRDLSPRRGECGRTSPRREGGALRGGGAAGGPKGRRRRGGAAGCGAAGQRRRGGEGGAARRRPPAGGRPLAARRAGRDMWPCWLCPQVPGAMAPPKDIMTNSHAKSILNAMNALRKSNTLCDVTLRVEHKDFPAHRIVLAACSDYFCAMFTSEVGAGRRARPGRLPVLCGCRAGVLRSRPGGGPGLPGVPADGGPGPSDPFGWRLEAPRVPLDVGLDPYGSLWLPAGVTAPGPLGRSEWWASILLHPFGWQLCIPLGGGRGSFWILLEMGRDPFGSLWDVALDPSGWRPQILWIPLVALDPLGPSERWLCLYLWCV